VFRSVDRHGRVGAALSDRAVAELVKHYAERAGLDPASFAGHSLRAGFVTSAAERGARAERIMDHTGHRSVAMLRVYTRRADAFADHAGAGLLAPPAHRSTARESAGRGSFLSHEAISFTTDAELDLKQDS